MFAELRIIYSEPRQPFPAGATPFATRALPGAR